MKTLLITLCFLLFLSACASTDLGPSELSIQLEEVSNKVVELEKSLSQQLVKSCEHDNTQLIDDVASAVVKKLPKPKVVRKPAKCSVTNKKNKITTLDGKLVFGAVEKIKLVKEKLSLNARIDTGALSSSLGVYRPTRFERDGKKWVKFALAVEQDALVYQYPIYGTINIKQESDEEAEYRYEIKIDVLAGGKKYRKQVFNLADRSHLQYQILIGRNFMRDIAVVDVSKKYLLGKNK